MSSQFSPETFLDMTMETPLERREPLPVEDYTAVIGDVKSVAWNSKDGSKSGVKLDVPLTIDIPATLQASLELPATLQIRDSIMLDLTDNGNIDMSKGKNNRLRQYREACDMNKVGDVFSPRKMTGQVIKVHVTHELYNGNILEKIGAVSKV